MVLLVANSNGGLVITTEEVMSDDAGEAAPRYLITSLISRLRKKIVVFNDFDMFSVDAVLSGIFSQEELPKIGRTRLNYRRADFEVFPRMAGREANLENTSKAFFGYAAFLNEGVIKTKHDYYRWKVYKGLVKLHILSLFNVWRLAINSTIPKYQKKFKTFHEGTPSGMYISTWMLKKDFDNPF